MSDELKRCPLCGTPKNGDPFLSDEQLEGLVSGARMSDELKPCPFCGGRAEPDSDCEKGLVFVSCENCFVSTPKVRAVSMVLEDGNLPLKNDDAALDEVARRWNRRANSDKEEE